MKKRSFLLTPAVMLLLALWFLPACSEKDEEPVTVDELTGLQLVSTLRNEHHTIGLYTANGQFQTGYNAVYFQIKQADGALVNDATASWQPLMHMSSMSHSCPASAIGKKANAESVYAGYIVFQMAGNETEYWELSLRYVAGGTEYTAKGRIEVTAAPRRVVESFRGSDSTRYILALAEPSAPHVATNDMKVALYKMESMMSFIPVEQYKIRIDPRMPGMGNHGSPNNTDLTQGSDNLYHGRLSLTMTGYWKINLRLENAAQQLLKGEAITESNESSSIYFEVEF